MLVLGWINETVIGTGIWIVSGIYKVVAFVFEIFLILSTGELVSQESYKLLIQNFYVILGIVMLFILAFSMLKGIVNPDDNKQGGEAVKKVITNLITSAIIMAVLPTVFGFLYDFQNSFIRDYNVIGKFFGYGSQGSAQDDPGSKDNVEKVKTGAYQIVNGVWTAFFNVNMEECSGDIASCQNQIVSKDDRNFGAFDTGDENCINKKCNHTFTETVKYVDETGKFGVYGAFSENADLNEVDFNFLLSLIGGILLLYVVVSYCFDMALRLVKLVFYQIIAPIPIFMRVIPEGKLSGMFNQWLKITLACYFEVYTRIFIFYFCIYLCTKMMEAPFLTSKVFEYGIFQGLLAKAFVLMGVITFMRQAPKLLSEITGIDAGKMKLGIKDKLAAGGAFTAGAILGGGITSAVRNATNGGGFRSVVAGGLSGAVRAGKAGWGAKSFKDMSGAASRGAAGAAEARDKRATYKSRHGGGLLNYAELKKGNIKEGLFGGTVAGHVGDTYDSAKRWAGFDNINALLAQQGIINEIQNERKSIDNESFDVIDGDLAKGKLSVNYDSASASHLGVTHDMVELRKRKAVLDALRAGKDIEVKDKNGNPIQALEDRIAAAEVDYSSYRADWADELRNISLLGEKNWASVDKSVQADLAKVRMASDKYRETVARNYNASYIKGLSNASDVLDREKDLTVKHSTLKDIKDEMKIENVKITSEINRIRQKDEEKKGK